MAAVLTVAAMWVLAIGTAAFSAANERQLRRQKVGLAALSAMVARMDELDAADRADEIPRILLAALGSTFGFTRGVVLSSSDGGRLEVLTATDAGSPRALPDGSDPAISAGVGRAGAATRPNARRHGSVSRRPASRGP